MLETESNIFLLSDLLDTLKVEIPSADLEQINYLVFLGDSFEEVTTDDCIGFTGMQYPEEINIDDEFPNPFGDGKLIVKQIDSVGEKILVELV